MSPTLAFLFNHIWQSTLVGMLAWLLCATSLRDNTARVRFGVWVAASLKFLVPIATLTSLGRWFGATRILSASQSQQIFDVVSASAPIVAPAPFTMTAAPQATLPWQQTTLVVLLAFWGAGALMIAARWIAQWRMIRRLADGATGTGVFQRVPVKRSREMHLQRIEPGVVGIVRPAILLPDGIDDELTASQIEAVLTHERQHVRRQDNLWAALHTLTQALFWFHPLVWFIGRRLADERERACDQAALETASPEDYAEGLLTVCKLYWRASQGHVTGMGGANLRARMESILSGVRPRPASRLQRCVLASTLIVLVGGAPCIGWLTAQALSPQENSFLGFATSATKKFEVASVRENTTGDEQWNLGPPMRGSITIRNLALAAIIAQSFRTNRTMVLNEPAWIGATKYDIVAKGPDPAVGNAEVWEMMRSLLIERFHLKYHVEERPQQIFALTVAPGGHKLIPGEKGRCAGAPATGPTCGDLGQSPTSAEIYNMPIGALITAIGRRAGRPIVDRTNLTGRYDALVTWLPAGVKLEDLNLSNVPQQYRPQEMGLPEALERQLGLKLQPEQAPMPYLAIDSVSRPDPN
jgi:bla regulator protein blaR1